MFDNQFRHDFWPLDVGQMPCAFNDFKTRAGDERGRLLNQSDGRRAVLVADQAQGRRLDPSGMGSEVGALQGAASGKIALARRHAAHIADNRLHNHAGNFILEFVKSFLHRLFVVERQRQREFGLLIQHAGGRYLLVGNDGFADATAAAAYATLPGDTLVFATPPGGTVAIDLSGL